MPPAKTYSFLRLWNRLYNGGDYSGPAPLIWNTVVPHAEKGAMTDIFGDIIQKSIMILINMRHDKWRTYPLKHGNAETDTTPVTYSVSLYRLYWRTW